MPDRYGQDPDDDAPIDRRAIAYAHAIATARAVIDCDLCNDDGYRGGQVCDHVDHTEAAKRGMAMIRETMGWTTP